MKDYAESQAGITLRQIVFLVQSIQHIIIIILRNISAGIRRESTNKEETGLISFLRISAWTISNLCDGKPRPAITSTPNGDSDSTYEENETDIGLLIPVLSVVCQL